MDIKKKLDSDSKKSLLGWALYFLVIVAWHISLNGALISDDEYRIENPLDGNFFDHIHSYWLNNGRATIDGLAESLVHHFGLWAVLDVACFMIIPVCIAVILNLKKYQEHWILLGLMMLVPLTYFNSAGWISTTTNYWFTSACVLFVVMELALILRRSEKVIPCFVLALIGISYAMFHDQYIVCVIMGELLVLVYMLLTKEYKVSKRNTILVAALFIVSVICYIIVYLSPGHQNRMHLDDGTDGWIPGYSSWTLGQKIYAGYTSTVANLIYKKVDLFIVICLLLAILAFAKEKPLIKRLMGVLPVVILCGIRMLSFDRFITVYDYACGLPDLLPLENGIVAYLGLAVSILLVLAVFVALFVLIDDQFRRIMAMAIMFIGAASREMIGFSSTIFASSYRTFIPFLICMILVSEILIREITDKKEESIYIPVGLAVLACFII